MLKVFLVEDEVIVRNGIKNNVDWEAGNFLFVGEASDGELAYPMIKNLMPDIIITDIKMPFMDGLEFSRLVKQEMPWIKIIILTGYDEFDYAKEAINIGITDYLLKPITSSKLMEAMKGVAKVIEEEKAQKESMERFQRELQENKMRDKTKFFEEIVSNMYSYSEIIQKGKELKLDLSAEYYNIVLLKIFYKEEMNQNPGLLVQVLENLEQLNFNRKEIIWFERGADGIAFLIKGSSEEHLTQIIDHCFPMILDMIRSFSDLEYFGGIGKAVSRLRELHICFNTANKAASYRYLLEGNQMVCYEELDQYSMKQETDLNLKDVNLSQMKSTELKEFLISGNKNEVKKFIDRFISSIGESNMKSFIFQQYILLDMNLTVMSFVEKIGGNMDEITKVCGDFKAVSSTLSSLERMKAYLESLITETIALRNRFSMQKYDSLLEKAKKYMKEHYNHENISLNTVAAAVNTSPSHFSTIFSQETGQTFIEYLTQIRMEKAKELLVCSGMRCSEIGYEVGYKDSHYFTYLFKKTQKITPTEFRTRGKK